MQLWKLGCRWSSNSPLFYDYLKEKSIVIGVDNKKYKIDDWLLITDGMKVLALAKVLNYGVSVIHLNDYEDDFKSLEIPFDNFLIVYKAQIIELMPSDQFRYNLQKGIVRVQKQEIIDIFFNIKNKYDLNKTNSRMEIINLLKYKKQIILQGPPGTGKTREAKLIAEKLIGGVGKLEEIPESIDSNIIKEYCIEGTEILSARDGIKYKIGKNTALGIEVIATSGKPYVPKFTEIIESYQKKVWENEGNLKGGNDSYSAALAKCIYKIFEERYNSNLDDQLKLIQFHPSYTYEDFVRGIVAKPNQDGDGIVYEAENKILGAFSKRALDNYLDSKKDVQTLTKEVNVKSSFELFKDYLIEEIEQSDGFYPLTDNVGLIYSDDTEAFRYRGDKDGWAKNGNRILFKDIIQAYTDGNKVRKDVKNNLSISGLARQHASYFIRVLNLFQEYINSNNLEIGSVATNDKTEQKNYVLIIDEINRANLSSVLGELIYALEYRGESVESMYAIDGDNKLVLPPNLYIIGTMNSADRSVGHIDYAIRRRFAFVDVLPKDLSDEEGITFDKALFNQVAELFDKNLSPEFKKKEVQLGHSYFIDKSKLEEGVSMSLRLKYEIRPILLEYVKDGVLIGETIESKIENLVASI
ncbi:AAA family ATPase [Sphingobacterium sp. HJSM2_6]|uniref:AAA family ATPase n=1 Tax=Sphingobacterium sp. HJSM2_6 TaxID=3366264 RepID=UPI003BBCC1A7